MSQSTNIKNAFRVFVATIILVVLSGCSGDARILEEGVEAHNLQLQSIAIKSPSIVTDPATGAEQKLFENTNQTIAFTIQASDVSGGLVSVSNDNRLWTVSNSTVATINESGVLQTHAAGTVSIGVSVGGIVAPPFELTVSDAPLIGINSIFGDKALERCMPQTYYVLGDFSDSTRVLKAASWAIENDSLGSYTNLPLGQVSVNGVNVGALELVATVGDFKATKIIDINDNLNEVIIQDSTATLEVGETLDLSATGRYITDDAEQLIDITSHVYWQVPEQQLAATVGSTTGILKGLEVGNTSVTASCGNLLSVAKPVVVSAAGSTADVSQLSFNETDSLKLGLSDGNYTSLKVSTGTSYTESNNVTASTTWTVELGDSVSVSLIDGNLTITPVRLGISSIKATYEGVTRSIAVQVTQ